MKKFCLTLIILLNFALGFSQCPPTPPPDGKCDCGYLMTWDNVNCEFVTNSAYESCVTDAGCAVPIDFNIIILFLSAISLGTYSIYKANKKRRFEN